MSADARATSVVEDRRPGLRVLRREEVPLERVLEVLRTPGELLKVSRKSETLRVGDWVVKRSRNTGGAGFLKHTFRRGRYRQAWKAALHLESRGVAVARAHAFVERTRLGLIFGNVLMTEYLDACEDVEAHAGRLIEAGAPKEAIHAYLGRIAEAVNRLCSSGAYHNDLAGKNILTRDGTQFYFIDLDGIVLHRPYDEALRLQNHVQLYDSFIDRWDDAYLAPFIRHMLPDPGVADAWMARVREGQKARRARTEAIWRQRGRPDRAVSPRD